MLQHSQQWWEDRGIHMNLTLVEKMTRVIGVQRRGAPFSLSMAYYSSVQISVKSKSLLSNASLKKLCKHSSKKVCFQINFSLTIVVLLERTVHNLITSEPTLTQNLSVLHEQIDSFYTFGENKLNFFRFFCQYKCIDGSLV